MKVLMHMLIDVPKEHSFATASRIVGARFAKSTTKTVVDAVSIERAKVVPPAILKTISDAVSEEIGIPIKDDQAKRIAMALDFGTDMDEIKFYDLFPEEDELF